MKAFIPFTVVLSGSSMIYAFTFDVISSSSLSSRFREHNGIMEQSRMGRICSSSKLQMTVTGNNDTMEVTPKKSVNEGQLAKRKQQLLKLLGSSSSVVSSDRQPQPQDQQLYESVLACPKTKQPLSVQIYPSSFIDGSTSGVRVIFSSSPKRGKEGEEFKQDEVFQYEGRTDTYYNLLTPISSKEARESNKEQTSKASVKTLINNARVFLPSPIRSAFTTFGILPEDETFIPMRDLFTSPSVSFAYERGWRQGFVAAGFPGVDKEFDMVNDYFAPVLTSSHPSTIVDMSCATGLFTRRFASSGLYNRVIGCDYSPSMLQEARRRILSDKNLQSKLRDSASQTKLELVRCDVAAIPMQSNSVDCLHAGAAMHCWPDVSKGLSEIYRVLLPNGGRFFATTFLSEYFGTLQAAEGGNAGPSKQAFQYFESKGKIEQLLREAGFEEVSVQILGAACVVIRAEK